MSNLFRSTAALRDRAHSLSTLSDEDLNRFATMAAHERDPERPWRLTVAFIVTRGRVGRRRPHQRR